MNQRGIRFVIGMLEAFIALTAIGGGFAMLSGVDRFPLEWLRDTPFSDYTIPALMLAILVGGASLIAFIMLIMRRTACALLSMIAGLLLVGFIVVEVLILKQNPPGPTPIEIIYFAVGLVIFGLAISLRGGVSQRTV